MLEVEEAWGLVAAAAQPLEAERATLEDAVGRVLAEDVRAPLDLPGFDRSSMDGWAVRALDLQRAAAGHPVELPVRGEVTAGVAGDEPLEPGTATRIGTGAPLPPGADAILRLEAGEQNDGCLTTESAIGTGTFVRRRGEDVRAGEVLLTGGTVLTPARLSVVASCGLAEVAVHRRARISILATGSELVAPGAPLRPGAIHDSNGAVLGALALQAGALPAAPQRVDDDETRTRQALERGLEQADVLLVSGGVSVGDRDLVKPALEDLGAETLFWRVRIKPGKPILAAKRDETWIFGLPGNPLSAVAGFLVFVGPLLRVLHGAPPAPARTIEVTVGGEARAADGRTTYATARLDDDNVAHPTPKQGSHMTKALADADGFLVIPYEPGVLHPGETARFLPLA